MTTRAEVLHVIFSSPTFLPPLRRAAWLQHEAGLLVRIVGVEVPDTPSNELPRWLEARTVMLGALQLPTGLRFVAFCALSLLQVARYRPGWLYVHDPKASPLGVLAVLLPGIRVAYHEHDAPGEGEPSLARRVIARCRRYLAARADACVVPSSGRLDFLPAARHAGQARLVVNNFPLRAESAPAHGKGHDGFRVVFMGSLNPNRLPAAVVEAVAAVPAARLWVLGYETVGHRGFTERLRNLAATLDVEDRLEVKGFVAWSGLRDLIRVCDLGLSLIPPSTTNLNERTMVGASNKPYQFLACEVPILVADSPAWRTAFVDRGVARACDPGQTESIRDALDWFVRHRGEAREMGRRGRELVLKEWNYETEYEGVLELLDGNIASTRIGQDERLSC